MTLKVIGAGLGRTGTTSLKQALTHLLCGPCFHFLEYGLRPELMSRWLAFDQEISKYDAVDMSVSVPATRWQSLMPGYIACVDEPASAFLLPSLRLSTITLQSEMKVDSPGKADPRAWSKAQASAPPMSVIHGGVAPYAAAITRPCAFTATKDQPHLTSSTDGPSRADPSR